MINPCISRVFLVFCTCKVRFVQSSCKVEMMQLPLIMQVLGLGLEQLETLMEMLTVLSLTMWMLWI